MYDLNINWTMCLSCHGLQLENIMSVHLRSAAMSVEKWVGFPTPTAVEPVYFQSFLEISFAPRDPFPHRSLLLKHVHKTLPYLINSYPEPVKILTTGNQTIDLLDPKPFTPGTFGLYPANLGIPCRPLPNLHC